MKNESKIVELLSEMVQLQDKSNGRMDILTEEVHEMKNEIKGMKKDIQKA